MSKDAIQEYLIAIRMRYINATKKRKKTILDEFCATTNLSRKHAIRLLSGSLQQDWKRKGPKPKYTEQMTSHLVKLWELMRRMCSRRMRAALPLWLNYYNAEGFNEETKALLSQISASSIDRLLKPYKVAYKKGLTSTKPGAFVKSQIPIELIDAKIRRPGFIEADTVAHCGDTLEGEFANSLTMTDLLSGWTENRAIWTKKSDRVIDKIKEIRGSLPFGLRGFSCDNGSEFINHELVKYLKEHKDGRVHFTRRRPYKKNDAAHVEQKNDATVRQLFGYFRVDDPELVNLMNDIYKNYWNPLLNYFCPVMKLKRKMRIGGKLRKFYDNPIPPCDRLINSGCLTDIQKQRLITTREGLDPITLKEGLDKKLQIYFKKVQDRSIQRLARGDYNDAA